MYMSVWLDPLLSSSQCSCMLPLQARTDVDIIMVPILELLMDFEKRSLTHVYILMIIMLIFSEEPSLAQNSGDIVLKSVSFYKARQLKNIKLDSLMYLVLLHVAHYNMLTTKDMYLQTNTLATLANVGPAVRDLHPIACQKLLNTLEKVNDRLDKIENADGTVKHSFGPLDVQLASDFVNIILEVLNAMIAHNLSSNATLVYSLMHKKECIDQIREKPQYRDVSENIGRVVEYFAERIERKSKAHHGSPLTSEAIQDIIQDSIKEWRSSVLKPSVDLKFSYEEGTYCSGRSCYYSIVPENHTCLVLSCVCRSKQFGIFCSVYPRHDQEITLCTNKIIFIHVNSSLGRIHS